MLRTDRKCKWKLPIAWSNTHHRVSFRLRCFSSVDLFGDERNARNTRSDAPKTYAISVRRCVHALCIWLGTLVCVYGKYEVATRVCAMCVRLREQWMEVARAIGKFMYDVKIYNSAEKYWITTFPHGRVPGRLHANKIDGFKNVWFFFALNWFRMSVSNMAFILSIVPTIPLHDWFDLAIILVRRNRILSSGLSVIHFDNNIVICTRANQYRSLNKSKSFSSHRKKNSTEKSIRTAERCAHMRTLKFQRRKYFKVTWQNPKRHETTKWLFPYCFAAWAPHQTNIQRYIHACVRCVWVCELRMDQKSPRFLLLCPCVCSTVMARRARRVEPYFLCHQTSHTHTAMFFPSAICYFSAVCLPFNYIRNCA